MLGDTVMEEHMVGYKIAFITIDIHKSGGSYLVFYKMKLHVLFFVLQMRMC